MYSPNIRNKIQRYIFDTTTGYIWHAVQRHEGASQKYPFLYYCMCTNFSGIHNLEEFTLNEVCQLMNTLTFLTIMNSYRESSKCANSRLSFEVLILNFYLFPLKFGCANIRTHTGFIGKISLTMKNY